MPVVFSKFDEIVTKHHGEMPPRAVVGRAHGNAVQRGINDQILAEVQEEYAEVLLEGLIDCMRTDGGDFLRFAITALLLTVGGVEAQDGAQDAAQDGAQDGLVGRVCELMYDLLPDEYAEKKVEGKNLRPRGLETALQSVLPKPLADRVFAKVTGNPNGSEFGIADFATVKFLFGPKVHEGLNVTAKAEFATLLVEGLFADFNLVYKDGVAEPPVLPTVKEVLAEMARKDAEVNARFMEAEVNARFMEAEVNARFMEAAEPQAKRQAL
jgi:hypothetical protein